jgi:glycoprotein endo-alpha-1,2-mannosidase
MKKLRFPVWVALFFIWSACTSQTPSPQVIGTSTPTVTPPPTSALAITPTQTSRPASSPTTAPTDIPVIGPEPSTRIAAFYYPWYGNPATNGFWNHWEGPNFRPPLDIPSDYYPIIGAYSSLDPIVVAQHFAWLRQAGVGVIISSWWGQGTFEDQAVGLLLEQAQRFGIQVAFHIEPYDGRNTEQLVDDIRYLYNRYASFPAFYRSTGSSRWSPDDRSKGLFFLGNANHADNRSVEVQPDYWLTAIDAIHNLPDGGLVIANATGGEWIDAGHFDGLYNYASLNLDPDSFAWAHGLPPGAWYVPSVIPGFSARRIGYASDTYVPRENGVTYQKQWQAALGADVEPALITITSFNEWHEGTQIEPAQPDAAALGQPYSDFDALAPTGYLTLTRQWADNFLGLSWPSTSMLHFEISTTSDWTTFGLIDGGSLIRPEFVSATSTDTLPRFENGRIALFQTLQRAEAGGKVQIVIDMSLASHDPAGTLTFEIERGHLGYTAVKIYRFQDQQPVLAASFSWGGIDDSTPRNARRFVISIQSLTSSSK